MRLSDLLLNRELLKKTKSTHRAKNVLNAYVTEINHVIPKNIIPPELLQQLSYNEALIQNNFEKYDNSIDQIELFLDREIAKLEPEYLDRSEEIYQSILSADHIALMEHKLSTIFRQKENIGPDERKMFDARIKSHSGWTTPGLIIRPGYDDFIFSMTASDPLYLVDTHQTLLQPALQKFNPLYQRRLRPYVINEYRQTLFDELPQGQFGLIWIFNLFANRPMRIIKKYLTEINDLLRPGGVVAFVFNDADRYQSVFLNESYSACYTPKRHLKTIYTDLGLKETYFYESESEFSYLELTKPGEITSLRGGQCFAKVRPKS